MSKFTKILGCFMGVLMAVLAIIIVVSVILGASPLWLFMAALAVYNCYTMRIAWMPVLQRVFGGR